MVQSKVLDDIENDDFFKYFLSGKETEPPTLALSDQIRKLSEGLETINSELQAQIRLQNPTLLKNAVSGNRLNKNLNTLSSEFQKLQERMGALKKQINDPYELMETHIKVLERLHNSSHLLRNVSSFLQLHKNLQSTNELEQQAHILFEMESLIEDKDLGKIHMIQEEKSNAISTKQRLLHIANRDLNSGLQNNNESQIVKSLQIYCNLNSLDQHLKNLSDTYINDIRESIRQIFNGIDLQTIQKTSIKVTTASSSLQSQNKGPGKVPTLSTNFHFWTKLLAGLDWLFTDELFSYCEQALLLQRCLKQVSSNFLSEQNSKDFVSKFSHSLSALLQESFRDAPIHVSQAIQQNLPKLLGSFNTLKNKLDKEFVLNKNIFSSLDVGYIEKIGGNMKVPLISAEVLTEEVIDGVLKSAAEEINVALIDDDLCLSVIDVFIACNQNFWSKVKSNIKYGTDSAQVLGIPNSVQIQNTNYCNLVYHHQVGLELLVHNLDLQNKNQKAFEKLKKNLIEGKAITSSVLKQLIDSMISAITIIFLSMHREPSLNTSTISVNTASMYMREFQEFLTRTWTSQISSFNDKVCISSCARELAIECIDLFVKNLSILRPISLKGRQRMKYDCQQLENTLQIIVPDLSVLGKSYRVLRSISTLIVQSPEDLIEQTSENTIIEPYIIMFMLFGFADNELESPHVSAGWTSEKLLQWLSEHQTDRERLELISGSLQKYRTIIRKKNLSQYCPVYPLISTYLEKQITALHM